jgi:signal transduction histidine kinase
VKANGQSFLNLFIPQSFKLRLILILTISQLLFLATIMLVGYSFIGHTIQEQLDKRVMAYKSQFESSIKTAMISLDTGTLHSVGQQAIMLPDITEFVIYIENHSVINEVATNKIPISKLRVSHKVFASGINIGRVDFTISLDGINANKSHIIFTMLLICFFELIIASLLAVLIGSYVGKRASYLVSGIEKYASGDLSFQYEKISNDEFGFIARSFNTMAQNINENSNSLEKLRAQNIESSKMAALGEMSAGIAHEINNPLSIILGKTTFLVEKVKLGLISNENLESELHKIENMANRIEKIINGLRIVSRNSENDLMESVNIGPIIEDSLSLCMQRFRSSDVKLNFKTQINSDIYIHGRSAQISQVILNLLGNAFDAVQNYDEKWVELSANATTETLTISVTDSGNGIAPNIVEKLMLPFFTTKAIGKGTGLGLSISKSIIENHKGKFYYDQYSGNTRFVIELPLVR